MNGREGRHKTNVPKPPAASSKKRSQSEKQQELAEGRQIKTVEHVGLRVYKAAVGVTQWSANLPVAATFLADMRSYLRRVGLTDRGSETEVVAALEEAGFRVERLRYDAKDNAKTMEGEGSFMSCWTDGFTQNPTNLNGIAFALFPLVRQGDGNGARYSRLPIHRSAFQALRRRPNCPAGPTTRTAAPAGDAPGGLEEAPDCRKRTDEERLMELAGTASRAGHAARADELARDAQKLKWKWGGQTTIRRNQIHQDQFRQTGGFAPVYSGCVICMPCTWALPGVRIRAPE